MENCEQQVAAPTVRERIQLRRAELTPAEAKVTTVLLDHYPLAGLQPVVALAAAAGVSPPTVLRLLAKLGFAGYRDLRDALTAELGAARSFTPLSTYPDLGHPDGSMLARSRRVLVDAVQATLADADPVTLERVVDWLASSAPVWLTGGKFSTVLATYLHHYLTLLRPQVTLVAATDGDRELAALDLGAGALCVVFDFRRYQADTAVFARRAADAGARVVVFTDVYLSPVADHADAVLTTVVNGPSPYDVLTPAFALVETVVALVTERIGPASTGRLRSFERWQEEDNRRR